MAKRIDLLPIAIEIGSREEIDLKTCIDTLADYVGNDVLKFQCLEQSIKKAGRLTGVIGTANVYLEAVKAKAAPAKRARKKDGSFQADDPSTITVNEAYVTGVAPSKKPGRKKKIPATK